jgi:hypothetical protein
VSYRDDEGNFDQDAWNEVHARRQARFPLIRKVNGWAAAAATIALFALAYDDVYDWLMKRPIWVPPVLIGVFVGLAVFRRWFDGGLHPAIAAWTIAGFVIVAGFTLRAFADASDYHVANCWHIEGTDDRWECAPGSEPRQILPGYDQISDQETPGHVCDYVNTTSSGGTIWQCHE